MKVIRSISSLNESGGPLSIAVGVFDGIHLGHQAVISRAKEECEDNGGRAAVVTFDPHPAQVLSPSNEPRLLTSTAHKLKLLGGMGIETGLIIPFDREFSETEPETFVRKLHASADRLTHVSVGAEWRFGHRCAGDVDLLRRLGDELGFAVSGAATVDVDGMPVSSTRIREAVGAGDFAVAERLLGRPYTVLGTVIEGRHLGRELGFPTANLTVHSEQLPPTGVYTVEAEWQGRTLGGVGNLGYRPSVEGGDVKRMLEVHLFEIERELYGDDLEIRFVRFLRPEQKFGNLDELKNQIRKDADAARQILAPGG